MSELGGEDVSWTGQGVGPGKESFLQVIRQTLPDYPAEEAGEAVLCSLVQRVSGGVAMRIIGELPEDLRAMALPCVRHADRPAPAWDKDEFYAAVAEHLIADAADARRICSAVFSGIHTQISDATAERIASQLPAGLTDTWLAARRRAPASF